jgi:hypothetical protein
MKLTENYLRNMINQVIKEMHDGDYGMSPMEPMSSFSEEPVDTDLLSSLEDQGYKVREIIHPTDSYKSYILQPKLNRM